MCSGCCYIHIPWVLELLESNLNAKFKNHINPALGYLFILNNNRHIETVVRCDPLRSLLDEDWTQIQASKVKRSIVNYLRCSCEKVLNSMKNINSNEPSDAIESLRLFLQKISDLCNVQSVCSVIDERLREAMRRYLKKIFLPRYKNFIERLKKVLGNDDAGCYIKYDISDY